MNKMTKSFLNVLSGDIFASLLSILSLSFITKGIGMSQYGLIILIQGIVSLVDGIFNFQSWQGFIKFYPKVRNDKAQLEKMIKFSYLLDVCTAFIAFSVVIAAKGLIGRFYSFSDREITFIAVFSSYILFNILGTPTGILRSYDRFDLFRNQKILTALANFILFAAGYFFKLDLNYFLGVSIFSNIFGGILLNYFAFRILKKEKLLGFIFQKNCFDREFFKFTLYTNINSSLDIPIQYFDSLLIGKYLSLEELGIYKILKTVANILDRIGTPIYQILYPYFCQAAEKKHSFKIIYSKLLKITAMLAGACIAMFIGLNTIGFPLLAKFFQKVILDYKPEINLYLLVKSLGITLIGIHPLFLAMGYIKKDTGILLLANGTYALILLPMIRRFGLTGVILAYGVQVLMILTSKSFIIAKNKSMHS